MIPELDLGVADIVIALGVLLIAVLTLAMVFYEQVMLVLAWVINITFALGLALAATSLLAGGIYAWGARALVGASGVAVELRTVDGLIESIRTLPDRILDQIKRPFSDDDEEESAEDAIAQTRATPAEGALERAVTDALAAGVALVSRTIAFCLGVSMMLVALLNRSGVDLVLEIRALRRRIEELEERDAW